MKESATIAMEYIKSNAKLLGINPKVFEKYNVHIHVPEGATPKDGPSAGNYHAHLFGILIYPAKS